MIPLHNRAIVSTILRSATYDDLPQITAMDQQIFGAYGADESPEIIRARLTVFPAGCVVLLDDVGGLLGYLTTEKWSERRTPALDEDPLEMHDPHGRVLNVTTLAVSPTAQGCGYGSLLVDQAIQIARREGCVEIVLETARARDFYAKLGFGLIEEIEQREIPMAIMRLGVG